MATKEAKKKEIVTCWAKYELTEEDKKRSSLALANKQIEKERLDGDRKCFVSTIKGKIDTLQSEITQLSESITNGYEFRNQRCEVTLNFRRKVKEFVSMETGKCVETRPLNPEDYQQNLDI